MEGTQSEERKAEQRIERQPARVIRQTGVKITKSGDSRVGFQPVDHLGMINAGVRICGDMGAVFQDG